MAPKEANTRPGRRLREGRPAGAQAGPRPVRMQLTARLRAAPAPGTTAAPAALLAGRAAPPALAPPPPAVRPIPTLGGKTVCGAGARAAAGLRPKNVFARAQPPGTAAAGARGWAGLRGGAQISSGMSLRSAAFSPRTAMKLWMYPATSCARRRRRSGAPRLRRRIERRARRAEWGGRRCARRRHRNGTEVGTGGAARAHLLALCEERNSSQSFLAAGLSAALTALRKFFTISETWPLIVSAAKHIQCRRKR